MVIEDNEKVAIKMNGKKTHGRKMVIDFREKLFEEHFGLSRAEQKDIVSDKFWNSIAQITRQNTLIFREVFHCYPDDLIPEAEQVESFLSQKPSDPKVLRELYDQKIPGIRGHAVFYPLEFMSKEKSLSSPEYFELGIAIAPRKLFT